MSSPPGPRAPHRLPAVLLVAIAVALVAGFGLAFSPVGLRGAIESAIGFIRAAGPVPFFVAMAIVPAPLAWFTIPAGEAFAAQLTLPGVIAAALAAVAVQIALCYWLARFAFRPVLLRWVTRRGYVVPKVTGDNALAVVLLVRLVPGPPLPLSCFLLGLAEVPFRTYLIVSWLITVPWALGGVVLGRGLLNGNIRLGGIGLGVLGAAAVAVHLVRRRLAARAPG